MTEKMPAIEVSWACYMVLLLHKYGKCGTNIILLTKWLDSTVREKDKKSLRKKWLNSTQYKPIRYSFHHTFFLLNGLYGS
jgi:hypothetical protein